MRNFRQYVVKQTGDDDITGYVNNVIEQPMVYQANPLVERKNNFNTLETKLFYLGLSIIRPKLPNSKYHDKDFLKAVIPIKEIIHLLGGNKVYYDKLKKVVEDLSGKRVFIENKKTRKFTAYPVFGMLDWDPKIGLTIAFNSYMYPFLLDLANRSYTRIEFEQIWKLSSVYAIRILELTLQYRSMGERTITITDLRKYLGIPDDAYKGRMDNFKKKAIEHPVAEINEKTHFNIIYDYKKTGRNVTAVRFRIVDKSEILDAEVAIVKKNAHAVVEELVAMGVDKAMANTVVKKYGHVYCEENANYIKEKYGKTAQNLAGYIIKAIQNDFFGEHRKKLDKEVMELWPTLDKEDIDALAELAYKKGDEAAMRRLILHQQERIEKHEQKYPYDADYDEY